MTTSSRGTRARTKQSLLEDAQRREAKLLARQTSTSSAVIPHPVRTTILDGTDSRLADLRILPSDKVIGNKGPTPTLTSGDLQLADLA